MSGAAVKSSGLILINHGIENGILNGVNLLADILIHIHFGGIFQRVWIVLILLDGYRRRFADQAFGEFDFDCGIAGYGIRIGRENRVVVSTRGFHTIDFDGFDIHIQIIVGGGFFIVWGYLQGKGLAVTHPVRGNSAVGAQQRIIHDDRNAALGIVLEHIAGLDSQGLLCCMNVLQGSHCLPGGAVHAHLRIIAGHLGKSQGQRGVAVYLIVAA